MGVRTGYLDGAVVVACVGEAVDARVGAKDGAILGCGVGPAPAERSNVHETENRRIRRLMHRRSCMSVCASALFLSLFWLFAKLSTTHRDHPRESRFLPGFTPRPDSQRFKQRNFTKCVYKDACKD